MMSFDFEEVTNISRMARVNNELKQSEWECEEKQTIAKERMKKVIEKAAD